MLPALLLGVILTRDDGGAGSGTPTATTTEAPFDRTKAKVGEPAPDFTLPDVHGRPVRLSSFRGRPVVLTFFASWCVPCEEELPVLEAVRREHGGRLGVVAVSYEDFADDARRFVQRLGITYPALLEDPTSNPVAERYGVHGIPVTFFLDAGGRIATEPLFGETNRRALRPYLDRILAP